jgi:hypothetical protein
MAECDLSKKYRLTDSTGDTYISETPGTLGGYAKLRLYGRLDCPSALGYITKGHYLKNRVISTPDLFCEFSPTSLCWASLAKLVGFNLLL